MLDTVLLGSCNIPVPVPVMIIIMVPSTVPVVAIPVESSACKMRKCMCTVVVECVQ
jgi:hypothetical protein